MESKKEFITYFELNKQDVENLKSKLGISLGDEKDEYEYRELKTGTIELTKYRGSGGYVIIPETIDGKVVESIGERTFQDCESLVAIAIPDSVTSIGICAFCLCKSLTEISIPNSVTSIGGGAFARCTNLKHLSIPESLKGVLDVDKSIVTVRRRLKSNESTNENKLVTDRKDETPEYEFRYEVQENGTVEITKYIGRGDKVVIPKIIAGKLVESIDIFAFYKCRSLTAIIIPNSVTNISKYAFADCTSLREITIPDSVTSIGKGAFSNCLSLTEITIPDSVTSISKDAFQDCASLTAIAIPDSVTSIGEFAFSGCESLTEITIPDSVASIDARAFTRCTNLKHLRQHRIVAKREKVW